MWIHSTSTEEEKPQTKSHNYLHRKKKVLFHKINSGGTINNLNVLNNKSKYSFDDILSRCYYGTLSDSCPGGYLPQFYPDAQ